MTRQCSVSLLLVAIFFQSARAQELAPAEGKFPPPAPAKLAWVDLLAGKLEDHWSDMNCSLAGSFELQTDDKGVAVLANSGRPIGLIRSMRAYENFVLEIDWRHLTEAPSANGGNGTTGNSGLYVWADPLPPPGNSFTRAVEVQVCNLGNGQWYTSHGDIFPIHGATMIADPRFGVAGDRSMPVEFRARKTGEWNRCRVTCVDGTIQQELNGALVTAGFRASPRKGYLCLESEGGPIEFRNVRIAELPGDPSLKAEQVARMLPAGARTTCLFDGLTLTGWRPGAGQEAEWAVQDRILRCAGRASGDITRPLPAGDFALQLDWANDPKAEGDTVPVVVEGLGLPGKIASRGLSPDGWNRLEITSAGGKVSLTVNGMAVVAEQALGRSGTDRTLRLLNPGRPINFCNIMWTEVAAKRP